MSIRVFLVDDHAVLRAGIRLILEGQEDLEVVGEASTVREARAAILASRPDVALVDLDLPDGSGVEVIRVVHEEDSKVRLVAVTAFDDARHLRSVLAAGGSGYIVKSASPSEILTAIRTVHAGRSHIELSVRRNELALGLRSGHTAPRLSAREEQVLVLVALGYTNDQIGHRLHINPKTVATYRSRLKEKLELRDRVDLVQFVLDSGLLDRNRDAG